MNNNNNPETEEVIVIVDEDGNEIAIEESEPAFEPIDVKEVNEPDAFTEVSLDEEYELEEPVIRKNEFDEQDEDIDYDDDEEGGLLGGMANKLLVILGGAVALIAIIVGIVFIGRGKGDDAVDFSTLGTRFAEIGVIGEANIKAITEARGAALDDLYEAEKNYDYLEADEETGITTVSLTLTSILKDLKIKFVTPKGKLIGNVPFEVEVTGPDGKTTSYTDTDKDGIIYQTDLAGGSYTVKLVALTGYDAMYDFSQAAAQSLTVKTQLDYQKVDVKNEIKQASQVAATEDAAVNETVQESKLTDTVQWVVSDKIASGNSYAPIAKTSVKDPLATLTAQYEAALSRFKRLSRPVNVADCGHNNWSTTGTPDGAGHHTITCQETDCEGTKEEDCNTNGADGSCSVCGYNPTPAHTHSYTYTSNNDGTHNGTCTCGNDPITNESCGVNAGETCSKCAYTAPAAPTHEHHYVWNNAVGNGQHTLACDSTTGTCDAPTKTEDCNFSTFSVKGSDADKNHKQKCAVCGFEKASACSFTVSKAGTSSDTKHTYSCACGYSYTEACVKGSDGKCAKCGYTFGTISVSLDRSAKKALFVGGDTFTVKATVEGLSSSDAKTVTWTSSDTNIATVSASSDTLSCTVTGKAAGTVTITATSDAGDKKASAAVSVVVAVHPKNDTTTKLLDNNGKAVYVYDAATKKYREAVYADYYSGVDLYTPTDVTYTYTGWWTIDGKTYFYDANGKKVTGDQVILGAKYSFDSNGVLKSGTGSFGIDVSTWNGTIDWSKVAKSGVSYAIIRCGFRGTTIGGLVEDGKFATNIKNATAAGVKVGVYFFTQAISEAEAVEEASMCLTLVDGYNLAYPIFIDVESATNGRANKLSKDERTKIVSAFCKTITTSGYKAGVYANKSWFTNNINTSELTSYTIWLAQYASAPTYTATRYDLWQYSDTGSIGGISGNVDLDLSYLGY